MRDRHAIHAPPTPASGLRRLGYTFALAAAALLAFAACTASGGATDELDGFTTPAPLETGPMATDVLGY